ncbi:MAG TPA: hypothetical protein VFQ21_06290 [Gemmatimonadota bacterium]|nr:hypothetical protein [Gemmatimonadota bacterium]
MLPPKDPRQKTGYQLRRSVVHAVRDAVRNGAAESQSAFVERALVRELRDLRKANFSVAYGEAARDPLFMEEMKATDAAWDAVTDDGLHANG